MRFKNRKKDLTAENAEGAEQVGVDFQKFRIFSAHSPTSTVRVALP
jgi:hypothetical protein